MTDIGSDCGNAWLEVPTPKTYVSRSDIQTISIEPAFPSR